MKVKLCTCQITMHMQNESLGESKTIICTCQIIIHMPNESLGEY